MFGQVPVYPTLSWRDGIAPPLDAPGVYLGEITRAENKTEPGRRAAEIMAPSSSELMEVAPWPKSMISAEA